MHSCHTLFMYNVQGWIDTTDLETLDLDVKRIKIYWGPVTFPAIVILGRIPNMTYFAYLFGQ